MSRCNYQGSLYQKDDYKLMTYWLVITDQTGPYIANSTKDGELAEHWIKQGEQVIASRTKPFIW